MNWFGEIPQNWSIQPLWTILAPRVNKNTEGLEDYLLSLSYGRIIRKDIETKTGLLPSSFNGYNIVEPGDIVLRLTDLQNDMRSLRTGFVKEHGIITSAYLTLMPKDNDVISGYYHYLLHSFDLIKGFYNMGEGIRQNLNYDELSKLNIILPPKEEQSRIASYLDSHIASIDDSIARYKTLSDKLDEYRKAIITRAVTKGIRGKRQMKESGEVWIGQIPSDWSAVKIKYLVSMSGERADSNENYISMENVESWTGRFIRTGATAEGDTLKIFPGQVIFGKLRPYLAKAYLVQNEGCCSGEFLAFNPLKVNGKYFRYGLTATSFINRVDVSTYGTKMPRANAGFITNLLFPVPSNNEQTEIVEFLDKQCVDIDKAKDKIDTIVKKLEAYKKSLIYNAVTGKIEC